eukprot:TRINITY_DN314_c0_g2_i1.p3 TRINITY_DN314_c0_g2~~TRINITY_DN314_c0_g2_i1.p3  ORF type:complete len:104 (+),score=6.55 TRINITY_DN314_c0_g2_i1:305-616(+)
MFDSVNPSCQKSRYRVRGVIFSLISFWRRFFGSKGGNTCSNKQHLMTLCGTQRIHDGGNRLRDLRFILTCQVDQHVGLIHLDGRNFDLLIGKQLELLLDLSAQ